MEKSNSGKIIAVIALAVAVIGLSVGFAAFSSTLNIQSETNAQIDTNLWNVGFADTTDTMADLATPTTVTGTTGGNDNGTLNMLKYTLSQGTAATLSTASGSSVTYNFKIKNAGQINAALSSITTAGLTCAYSTNASGRIIEQDETPNTGAQVTQGTGDIADTDCRTMFTATLTIGGTGYNITSSTVTPSPSNTLNLGNSVDASLTIASTGTTPTNVPNGDFKVTLGPTTVVYGSSQS